jgi:hypothetical protein
MNCAQRLAVLAVITVPPFLLDICFLALMLLGIYIIVKAISNRPRDGQSEFSLLGSQVKVKGPAWLVMLVVGALMAGAPVIVATAQYAKEVPFETPTPATTMQKIPEPNYSSFTFSSDLSVLDLRSSFERPWYTRLPGWSKLHGTHVRIRPATLINTMTVTKIAQADYIYLKYTTSGTLDLRCLTHPYTTQITARGDAGQIIADVRSVKIGESFTIITEVTYWNAFRGSQGDDFTTYTHNQTNTPEAISLAVIFPDQRPFMRMQMLEEPPNAANMRVATSGTGWPAPRNQTYYWATTTASGEWLFTAKWNW